MKSDGVDALRRVDSKKLDVPDAPFHIIYLSAVQSGRTRPLVPLSS